MALNLLQKAGSLLGKTGKAGTVGSATLGATSVVSSFALRVATPVFRRLLPRWAVKKAGQTSRFVPTALLRAFVHPRLSFIAAFIPGGNIALGTWTAFQIICALGIPIPGLCPHDDADAESSKTKQDGKAGT